MLMKDMINISVMISWEGEACASFPLEYDLRHMLNVQSAANTSGWMKRICVERYFRQRFL